MLVAIPGSNTIGEEDKKNEQDNRIADKYVFSYLYKNIVHYFVFLRCPTCLYREKYKALRLKTPKYVIVNGLLYWKDHVGVLLLYLTEGEQIDIFNEYHGCACGGHYSWKVIARESLKVGFYWPILFFDVYRRVRCCEKMSIFL